MARFYLNKFVNYNMTNDVTAVSWQVSTDPAFIDVVAETIMDRVNLVYWETPLKKPDGTFYTEEDELYVRVKVHTDNGTHLSESDWFMATHKEYENGGIIRLTIDGEVVAGIRKTVGYAYEKVW